MNSNWQSRPASDEPWVRSDKLRRMVNFCKIAHVVLIIMAAWGISVYIKQANRTPPVVLEGGDGHAYLGHVSTFSMGSATYPALVTKQITESLQAMFLMTEKGPVPGLEDVIHPYALKLYQGLFVEALSLELKAGFYQELIVAEVRYDTTNSSYINANFRAFQISRDARRYARTEVYLATQWRKVPSTESNPLGWMLYGLLPISKTEFYAKELSDIRRAALNGAADTPSSAPVKAETPVKK